MKKEILIVLLIIVLSTNLNFVNAIELTESEDEFVSNLDQLEICKNVNSGNKVLYKF